MDALKETMRLGVVLFTFSVISDDREERQRAGEQEMTPGTETGTLEEPF